MALIQNVKLKITLIITISYKINVAKTTYKINYYLGVNNNDSKKLIIL